MQNKTVRTLNSLCKRANSVRLRMEERHTMYIVRTSSEERTISPDCTNFSQKVRIICLGANFCQRVYVFI